MPQTYPAHMTPQQQPLPQSFNAFASPTENTYPANYENLTLESEPIPQGGFAMYQSPSNSSYNPSSPQSELPPSLSTAASAPSIQSANSSTVGSPYSAHTGGFPNQETYGAGPSDLNIGPAIVNGENFDQVQFGGVDMENYPFEMADKVPNFVGKFHSHTRVSFLFALPNTGLHPPHGSRIFIGLRAFQTLCQETLQGDGRPR